MEIDLTRQGKSVVALPHDEIPQVKAAAYVASICPGWESRRREVFPISLRKRLPILPIPLRENEPRVNLDLQKLIDQVYTLGRYELTDYSQPVEPGLPAEGAEWAQAFFG